MWFSSTGGASLLVYYYINILLMAWKKQQHNSTVFWGGVAACTVLCFKYQQIYTCLANYWNFIIFVIENIALKNCQCCLFVPHNQCRHLFLQCNAYVTLLYVYSRNIGGSLWPTYHALRLQNLPCTLVIINLGQLTADYVILNQKSEKNINNGTVINRIFNNIHVYKKKSNTRLQLFKTTNVHVSKSQYLDILQQFVLVVVKLNCRHLNKKITF